MYDVNVMTQTISQSTKDPYLLKSALFTKNRKYRYELRRVWDESKPQLMFIGLNPSIADEVRLDPTVTRCVKYAQRWGFGSLIMTNIFSLVSTDPRGLLTVKDPVGPENDKHLIRLSKEADLIVAAWGNHGKLLNRSDQVRALIPNLHCLRVTGEGEPWHPLYLPGNLSPVPYIR